MKKILLLVFLGVVHHSFGQTILMQDGTFNTCTGTFYDTGGAAGAYANDENFTITFCPDVAGMAISLDFTVFALESGADVMTIYDGPDTTAPLIGSFTGGITPGTVYTSPGTTTGCLTVVFESNFVVVGAGWEAAISCVDPATIPLSPFITVDTISYTIQELVEDILIDSPCADSSNYTSGTGIDFGSDNGIGYFNAVGTGFPFAEGVVLSSGAAVNAEGPNDVINSDGGGGWPGDADLAAVLGVPLGDLNNASFIKFDFVPSIPDISFDFILASEEYNQNFECTYSDAFAFILTNQLTGVVTNLAVLPGTATPIEVTNIHPDVPGLCPAINEEYFGQYNFLPFNDETTSPTDFNGQTAVLSAMGTVTPGEPYDIKLVIADDGDTLFDAAVFIEAGSFNIDVNLGDDITIADGTAPCEGETITVTSGGGALGATYQWYLYNDVTMMFDALPGETATTIMISDPGLYQLEVIFASGCTVADQILIEFYPAPVPGAPDPLTICDALPNDGFADFTLTDADVQIIDGATGVSVYYYETLADAQAGGLVTALTSPYTNIVNPQIVYARLENDVTRCFDIVELTLEVFDTPEIFVPIADFEVCDDDFDGFFTFDLTTWDVNVALDPASHVITYHLTLADANAGTAAITPADSYTNTSTPTQTIYARVENADGCINVGEFDLVVNPLPVITPPTIYELCDYDGTLDDATEFDLSVKTTEMTGDDPLLFVSYHLTMADADFGTPALPILYTNVTNPQTIWTRIEVIATGCYVIDSFDLFVLDTPFANPPTSLKECDTDMDGIDEFDLTQADAEIIGGQTDVVVSYYFTLAEAQVGDPATALASPYTNVTSPQTVYARIENTITGCFDTTELELIVILANGLPTYELCDDDVADGFTVFDLTVWDFEIAADPTGLDITYYDNAADASTGTSPITPATAYTNTSNPQGMFVRVVNSDGCVTIGIFDLLVLPLPLFTVPTPLELCDDAVLDGFTEFDLTVKDAEISAGDPDLTITYYLTEADADAAMPALPSLYTNITNPQIIYARIESATTGCHDTTPLELIVNPPPTAFPPTPLERCDNNADDVALFDLTLADADIIGGQPDTVVSYYFTLAEANVGDPATALVSPYANTSNPQTVYARIEFTTTGCFATTELELIVLPSTDIGAFARYELCDDPIADGFTEFDLTVYDDIVVPDPTGLIISYYEDPTDAATGTSPITPATAFVNSSNPQTIYVRTEDADECVQLGTFEVFVIARPLFTVPTPYALCEDDVADGFTEFDLTVNNLAIIDGNPFYSVAYYLTNADAEAGTPPLPPLYTNVTNPQIIYVRVDDSSTGCYGVEPLELIVVNPSAAMTPTPLEYCDPDNDGFGEFNLEDATLEITGGDPTLTVTYHETEANATSGLLPLSSPYNNIVFGTQTIYARVETPLVEDCFVIVELQLIVLDTPQIVDPEPLLACDDNDDGIVVFDLTVKNPEIL
ncbi:MAG: choice-of-anchor L domain-containing protein, partial [Gilvibacter sp.]